MRGADEFKTGRARHLRAALTDAEGVLWYRLRARRLNGHKFVRQVPIGPYTVDFVCRKNDVSSNLIGVLETIVTALAETPPHPDR